METLIIKPTNLKNQCPIHIGRGILGKISSLCRLSDRSDICILTDTNIPVRIIQTIKNACASNVSVLTLQPGEQTKTIQTVRNIWQHLQKLQFDRKSLLINIGGGVISDVGGFAASTFMRGIDFINIPTTLLSQADAAIGGKNGINFNGIKNHIGTIIQPIAVIVDVNVIITLTKRELISGMAEIIKHGLICDSQLFRMAIAKQPDMFSPDELLQFITVSIRIKSRIVSADEKEQSGIRTILNFGHTTGHAIEALSQNSKHSLLHGETILWGMKIETMLSKDIGLLKPESCWEILRLLQNISIPPLPENLTKRSILSKIHSDKKNQRGKTLYTLLASIGHAVINQHVSDDMMIHAFWQTKGVHL